MPAPNRFDSYYDGSQPVSREGRKRVFERMADFDSERLTLSGSANAGSARAKYITISGSGHIDRDIAGETLDCSGSLRVGGDIKVARVEASGSLESGGGISSEYTTISGSCRAANEIYAERELSSSGSIRARTISSSGRAEISGIVETDTVESPDVKINGGGRIGVIECVNCTINRGMKGTRLFGFALGRRRQKITVERVAATGKVDIDCCSVKEISAHTVTVGRDCIVGRISYTGSCHIEDGAEIGETPAKV